MRFVSLVQVILLIIFLSSCSLGKRYHTGGFHLEWSSRGGVGQAEKSIRNNHFNRREIKDVNERFLTDLIIDTGAGGKMIFSVIKNKTQGAHQQKSIQDHQFPEGLMPKPTDSRIDYPGHTTFQFKPEGAADNYSRLNARSPVNFKSNLRASESHDSGGSGLRTFGWILIILGALVVFFLSIALGAVMVLLGVLFAISDRKKEPREGKKTDPKPTEETKVNEELVDVLYLKNGSMIRGKVLEFISGGNVKIQTADGSIFVYKSEEVEKIVKEPVKR